MKEKLNKLGFESIRTLNGYVHTKPFNTFDLVIRDNNFAEVNVSIKLDEEDEPLKEIFIKSHVDLKWIKKLIKLLK